MRNNAIITAKYFNHYQNLFYRTPQGTQCDVYLEMTPDKIYNVLAAKKDLADGNVWLLVSLQNLHIRVIKVRPFVELNVIASYLLSYSDDLLYKWELLSRYNRATDDIVFDVKYIVKNRDHIFFERWVKFTEDDKYYSTSGMQPLNIENYQKLRKVMDNVHKISMGMHYITEIERFY